MTALATTPDLSFHEWTIVTDKSIGHVSVHDILPVMATPRKNGCMALLPITAFRDYPRVSGWHSCAVPILKVYAVSGLLVPMTAETARVENSRNIFSLTFGCQFTEQSEQFRFVLPFEIISVEWRIVPKRLPSWSREVILDESG